MAAKAVLCWLVMILGLAMIFPPMTAFGVLIFTFGFLNLVNFFIPR